MAADVNETKDGGILRDKYGRRQIVAVEKHAVPANSDVPTPGGYTDADGREQVVLLDPTGQPFTGSSARIAAIEADMLVLSERITQLEGAPAPTGSPSRRFTGSERVAVAMGSIPNDMSTGIIMLGGIICIEASDAVSDAIISYGTSAGAERMSLFVQSGRIGVYVNGGSSQTSPVLQDPTAFAEDHWHFLYEKAAGSAVARFHAYNFTTGAFIHADMSGAQINPLGGANDRLWLGKNVTDAANSGFRGLASQLFMARPAALLGDAGYVNLLTDASDSALSNVLGATAALWDLNQADETVETVVDVIGAADETAHVGTDAVAFTAPAKWQFGLTVPAFPWTSGATLLRTLGDESQVKGFLRASGQVDNPTYWDPNSRITFPTASPTPATGARSMYFEHRPTDTEIAGGPRCQVSSTVDAADHVYEHAIRIWLPTDCVLPGSSWGLLWERHCSKNAAGGDISGPPVLGLYMVSGVNPGPVGMSLQRGDGSRADWSGTMTLGAWHSFFIRETLGVNGAIEFWRSGVWQPLLASAGDTLLAGSTGVANGKKLTNTIRTTGNQGVNGSGLNGPVDSVNGAYTMCGIYMGGAYAVSGIAKANIDEAIDKRVS